VNAADFSRAFAAAYSAEDAAAVAGLFTDDACLQGLSGFWAEGQEAMAEALASEMAGLARTARLVSGRTHLRPLGPGAAVLHQRFVVTGLRDEHGNELPRVGAMLTAVLIARVQGWRAMTATFSAVEP
jgi:uncharacterized protein (TIGR02246 family)